MVTVGTRNRLPTTTTVHGSSSPLRRGQGSAARGARRQPRRTSGPAVAHLVLLARAARALRVPADLGERVVVRGDGAAADHFGLPRLGRRGVGQVLRLPRLLEPLGTD